MRRAILILIVAVAVAAVVIAVAPASVASVAVESATNGVLTLATTDGTLWRGHGTLAAGRALRVPLAWSVDPWPLLRGELHVRLLPATAAGRSPRAEISARRDAITLREVDVTFAADIVESLAPRAGVRVTGEVRLTASSLDWTPSSFRGDARVDWQDALVAIAADPGIRLGTVSATLAGAGDRLSGRVTNDGGAFDVRGMLALSANGAPDISITMTPRGGDPGRARTLTLTGGPGATSLNLGFQLGPR
ncbi:MAG: type II secretion system protein N [Casimicrobiaceae bacterium]